MFSPLWPPPVSPPWRLGPGPVSSFPSQGMLPLGSIGVLLIPWPPQTQNMVVCGLRAAGSSAELGRGRNPTWAATSQMPVGTGFIQFCRPPCPRKALSGPWRQLCYLGVLPAWASSREKPQRPLETAAWGYTHAHTQCAHTQTWCCCDQRHTCIRACRHVPSHEGPRLYGKAWGPGSSAVHATDGPFKEGLSAVQ